MKALLDVADQDMADASRQVPQRYFQERGNRKQEHKQLVTQHTHLISGEFVVPKPFSKTILSLEEGTMKK